MAIMDVPCQMCPGLQVKLNLKATDEALKRLMPKSSSAAGWRPEDELEALEVKLTEKKNK